MTMNTDYLLAAERGFRDGRLPSEVAEAERFLRAVPLGTYGELGRIDRIRYGLHVAVLRNQIIGWQCYSPDGRRRWLVTGYGWERKWTTKEAEQFLHGYFTGLVF